MNIGINIVIDPVSPSFQRRFKLVCVSATHGRQCGVRPRRPILRTWVCQSEPKSRLQTSINNRSVVRSDHIYRLYPVSIGFIRVKVTDFLCVRLGIQPFILEQVLHAVVFCSQLFDERVLRVATAMCHSPGNVAVMGEVHHQRHSRDRVT